MRGLAERAVAWSVASAFCVLALLGSMNLVGESARGAEVHAEISIYGDSGFTSANGVRAGTGTAEDPFIISDWDITPSSGYGIRVYGTTLHYVIRNVTVHSVTPSYSFSAIFLDDARGGVVTNVTTWDMNGILVWSSDNVTLTDCIFMGGQGLNAQYSGNLTIADCEFLDCNWAITVIVGPNVNISGNLINGSHDSYQTIDLQVCDDAIIHANTVVNCSFRAPTTLMACKNVTIEANDFGLTGVYLESILADEHPEFMSSHHISTDNTVNGKPLIYLVDQQDVALNDVPVGQLIAVDCPNLAVSTVQISNTSRGISIYNCTGPSIYGVDFTDCQYGISAVYADGLIVTSCGLSRCERGIIVSRSLDAQVALCGLDEMVEYGISLWQCYGAGIVGNAVNGSGYSGIELSNYDDAQYPQPQPGSVIANNTITNAMGALEIRGRNITVSGNTVLQSYEGIGIMLSDGCHIVSNVIGPCLDTSMMIMDSTNMTVERNAMTDGGILLWASSVEAAASHSITSDNTVNGFPVLYYKNTTGAVVADISAGQVIIANCTQAQVSNVRISYSSNAVSVLFSDQVEVTGCTFSQDDAAVWIEESSNISINWNSMNWNGNSIVAQYSSHVAIEGNDMHNGSGAEILIMGFDNVTIADNVISNSTEGIALYSMPSLPSDCVISSNSIGGTGVGILLGGGVSRCSITNNSIHDNIEGISAYSDANNCTIYGNNISHNQIGISLRYASYNLVYHNSFINNSVQAIQEDTTSNRWDNGYPDGGNFWSGYTGEDIKSGPAQNQPGYDGIGDTSYNYSGIVDNYPLLPVVPLTTTCSIQGTKGLAGWHVSTVEVSFTATGGRGGLNKTEYRLDGSTWQKYAGAIEISGEGVHSLEFRSVDNMSHVESSTTMSVMIDTVGPETTAASSGGRVWLNATDATSGIGRTMYKVDDGSWTAYSGNFAITSAGTHTLSYYSVDVAGNTEPTATLSVVVEKAQAEPSQFPIALVAILAVVAAAAAAIAVVLMRRRPKAG